VETHLQQLLQEFTAGDPTREGVLWTNLSLCELSRHLKAMGTPASRRTIRRLLKKFNVGRRKAKKNKAMGHHPDRNAQFENITRLRQEHVATGDPIISIDTKNKEKLGNYYRPGHTFTAQTVETFDHDFDTAKQGKIIPHGIYDVTTGQAFIHLNTSHDTSELCCDSIFLWWEKHGRQTYPHAKRILILCDGGGSNNAKYYIFKEDLQRLCNRMGIEVRVAHFPPYCSKYNLIEHRVFPHVTRACQGVIFHTVNTVKQFMERAKTSTGLSVVVEILEKVYATGRKYAADFKATMKEKIHFDAHLPQWNYSITPESG